MPRLECQSVVSIDTLINMVFVIITELLVCLRESVCLHGITKGYSDTYFTRLTIGRVATSDIPRKLR